MVDFLTLKHYSHATARMFSPQRWSLIGDAGAFRPLLLAGLPTSSPSPPRSPSGSSRPACAAATSPRSPSASIASTCSSSTPPASCTRKAAPIYGSPRVLPAKVYWDDFVYWSFVCQYFFRGIFKLPADQHERFELLGHEFAALQFRAQKLLSEWARRVDNTPRPINVVLPVIPSLLASLYLDLMRDMSPDETYAYMRDKLAQAGEILGELALRALAEVGPEQRDELARAVDLPELAAAPSGRPDRQRGRGRRQAPPLPPADRPRHGAHPRPRPRRTRRRRARGPGRPRLRPPRARGRREVSSHQGTCSQEHVPSDRPDATCHEGHALRNMSSRRTSAGAPRGAGPSVRGDGIAQRQRAEVDARRRRPESRASAARGGDAADSRPRPGSPRAPGSRCGCCGCRSRRARSAGRPRSRGHAPRGRARRRRRGSRRGTPRGKPRPRGAAARGRSLPRRRGWRSPASAGSTAARGRRSAPRIRRCGRRR